MKYNVTYVMRDPTKVFLVPNSQNPITATDLRSLLGSLASNLPYYDGLGIEMLGVHVDPEFIPWNANMITQCPEEMFDNANTAQSAAATSRPKPPS